MITIDLASPEGNVFRLLGLAKRLAEQLDLDSDSIIKDMKSGDYEHLLSVFKQHFGTFVFFENEPGENK
jgi:hypothetical protein